MLAPRPWDPRLGPLQLATVRRALEREGMTTAWWSDLPGTRVPLHTHAYPATRWVLEGFLRVTTAEEAVELGPGDRLDLPANVPYTIEAIGLGQAIYVSGMLEGGPQGPPVQRPRSR